MVAGDPIVGRDRPAKAAAGWGRDGRDGCDGKPGAADAPDTGPAKGWARRRVTCLHSAHPVIGIPMHNASAMTRRCAIRGELLAQPARQRTRHFRDSHKSAVPGSARPVLLEWVRMTLLRAVEEYLGSLGL